MEIKRLYMKNVLSVGDTPLEIIFTSTPGITYIQGLNLDVPGKSSNGAGKSTIMEGILLGMYGRTLRREHGKPLTIEALIHDEDEDLTGVVELEYDNVKITRNFNPTKVEFWVDNEPKHVASAPQTRKELEKVVNINFETMCNILLFGQHNMFSFLEAGEPEKREVIENLMNLKEYNLYEEKAKDLRRESKQKIEILTQSHQTTKEHLVSQETLLAKQQAALNEYKKEIEESIINYEQQILSLPKTDGIQKMWEEYNSARTAVHEIILQRSTMMEEIKSLSANLQEIVTKQGEELLTVKSVSEVTSSVDTKISQLDVKKSQLMAMIDAKKSILQKHMSSITALKVKAVSDTQATSFSQKYSDLVSEKKVIENEGGALKQKIQNIESNPLTANATCTLCFGKVNPENAHHILKHYQDELVALRERFVTKKLEITAVEEEIKNKHAQIASDAKNAIDVVQKEVDAINEEINSALPLIEKQYKTKLDQLKQEKDVLKASVTKNVSDINAKYAELKAPYLAEIKAKEVELSTIVKDYDRLNSIQKPTISIEDISKILASKLSLEQKIKEGNLALTKNPYEEVLKSLCENVKTIEDKIITEADNIRSVESLLPYYDFWATAMGNSGIKSFLIDQIIPMLNGQIDYWLQIIYQGAISVEFDKYLNVIIKNNASKKGLKRYGQGSGGERRRIDIAIMLAFRQIMKVSTGKNPNIVFFDEVAENIDECGLQWLYDVLADLSKTSRVYVITHNPGLLTLMQTADKITIVKQNGASKIQ